MPDDCQNERVLPRYDTVAGIPLLGTPRSEPNPKQAYGNRKVPLALFPSAALIYGALAFADGAGKYGAFNWRNQPVELMTYMHAAMRHGLAWLDGQNDDPDSPNGKTPHLGSIIACTGIMVDAIETGNAIDNRPTRGAAAELLHRYERNQ